MPPTTWGAWLPLTTWGAWLFLLPLCIRGQFRAYDGTANNEHYESQGSVMTPLIRLHDAFYEDGVSKPPRQDGPSAREVMHHLFLGLPLNKTQGTSQFLPAFGQLVAHDILELRVNESVEESFPILCSDNVVDMWCPLASNSSIDFQRAEWTLVDGVRFPLNHQTAYLDGSTIYGLDEETVKSLRSSEGGKMNLTEDGLPHYSYNTEDGIKIQTDGGHWMLGDARNANNLSLLCLVITFLREHNRRAEEIKEKYPSLDDEELFQRARQWVVALIQTIFEAEYAPRILGKPLDARVYDEGVDSTIDVFFAAVAFRYGHSAVSNVNRLLDREFYPISGDPMPLRQTMYNTRPTIFNAGIESILRGLMVENEHSVDAAFVDDLLLFDVSIPVFNVQRGRDLGVCSFNDCREPLGLHPLGTLEDLTDEKVTLSILRNLYGELEGLDPYVGALTESMGTGLVPPLMLASIKEQYQRLLNGDRLWHNTSNEFEAVDGWSLARVIKENCDGMDLFPVDAFSTATWSVCSGSCSSTGESTFDLDSSYDLKWDLDDFRVNFTITVGEEISTGFIGLGFGSVDMEGADIVFCEFDGTGTGPDCYDGISVANRQPDRDIDVGGTDELTNVAFSVANGFTTVSWVRPLLATEVHDNAVETSGTTDVVVAYNPHSVSFHGMNRIGRAKIDFSTGVSTTNSLDSDSSFFAFHGAVMLLAWCVIGPIGIFAARYMKVLSLWLEVHHGSMAFVAETVIPLAASALATTKGQFHSSHSIMGTLVMVLVAFQVASGFKRISSLKSSQYDIKVKMMAVVHMWGGRALAVLAIFTCYHGLCLIAPDTTLTIASEGVTGDDAFGLEIRGFGSMLKYYWTYIGFLGVVFAIGEVRLRFQNRYDQMDFVKCLDLPILDLKEFRAHVDNGSKWVLVDDAIVDLDINNLLENHPGGARVLRGSIGTDIKKELAGDEAADTGHSHRHSAQAMSAVAKMVVGYIGGSRNRSGLSKRAGDAGEKTPVAYQKYTLSSATQVCKGDDRPVFLYTFMAYKDEKQQPREIKAGEYMRFQASLPDGTVVQRSYHMVEMIQYGERRGYRFVIRLYPFGLMSGVLRDLKHGSKMRMIGPFNLAQVRLPPFDDYVYMFAGGTGVSPMLQIIYQYLGSPRKGTDLQPLPRSEHGEGMQPAPVKAARQSAGDHDLTDKEIPLVPHYYRDEPSSWPPNGTGNGKLLLVWQAKSESELYLRDWLESWRDHSGGRFSFICIVQQSKKEDNFRGRRSIPRSSGLPRGSSRSLPIGPLRQSKKWRKVTRPEDQAMQSAVGDVPLVDNQDVTMKVTEHVSTAHAALIPWGGDVEVAEPTGDVQVSY
ncbi:unnamed protein product [Choristocarpus tenellus]